jgi:predicted nicotinamide N-methyase
LQQSSRHIAAQGFDVVIGADLLYDPAHHTALLHSLQQLATASPHVQVYLCWRQRQLGEEAFLTAAAAAGWVIEAVPVCLLHPEFQDGCYQLVRMVHLP